jgi:hypothetical protein
VAFTVEDFQDLVRLLEQHPEWRAELRRLVLTEELLELPALVRDLAEAQRRTEGAVRDLAEQVGSLAQGTVRELAEHVGTLAQAQTRTEERVTGVEQALRDLAAAQTRTEGRVTGLEQALRDLAQAQTRTEARVTGLEQALRDLAEAQTRTEVEVRELARAQQELARGQEAMRDQLSGVRGDVLEIRYREHAGGFFGRLLRRARVVGAEELDAVLEQGVADGALDEDTAHEVRLADLVVRGRRPGQEGDTYLIIEVSAGIGAVDVERAARRAALLGRVRSALAVVAGEWLTPEARTLAASAGVWQVLDGRTLAPGEQ